MFIMDALHDEHYPASGSRINERRLKNQSRHALAWRPLFLFPRHGARSLAGS
jgi:hypothetical protein